MKIIKVFLLFFLFTSITACDKYKYVPDEIPNVTSGRDVSIMFVNVGKADAIIIKIDEKAFVIDTGEKKSLPSIITAINYLGVKELEGVFLTHTHTDHIGGFDSLVDIYNVKKLYSSNFSMSKKNGENKIEEIGKENNIEHDKLKAGDKVYVFDDVFFKVLGPVEYNDKDDNDNSLVMKLFVNGKVVLFTGDMQKAEEYTLLDRKIDLRADILKVGNHGNKDATTKRFTQAVNPKYSVISTDTSVDTNSAHTSVKKNLNNSNIYVTEDFDIGVNINITKDSIDVTTPKRIESVANISIENVNRDNQTVTLRNKGEVIDISGYFLLSSKGNEIFVFPEDSVIKSNSTFSVSSTGYEGDFIWDVDKVWKKDDTAILYDFFGNVLDNF